MLIFERLLPKEIVEKIICCLYFEDFLNVRLTHKFFLQFNYIFGLEYLNYAITIDSYINNCWDSDVLTYVVNKAKNKLKIVSGGYDRKWMRTIKEQLSLDPFLKKFPMAKGNFFNHNNNDSVIHINHGLTVFKCNIGVEHIIIIHIDKNNSWHVDYNLDIVEIKNLNCAKILYKNVRVLFDGSYKFFIRESSTDEFLVKNFTKKFTTQFKKFAHLMIPNKEEIKIILSYLPIDSRLLSDHELTKITNNSKGIFRCLL